MTSESNSLIAKNTLFLFVRMLLLMAVSLYTSRVVLRYLGVDDFGIYNVVGSVVFIFGSLSASMNAASNRYIVLALAKPTDEEKRNIFSAVFFIHIVMGIVIFLLVEIIGLYLFNTKLVIPESRMNAAFWVFQTTAVSVVFLFVNYPYNSLIIAHERMNVFALFSIFDALLRLGIAYLLPLFAVDKLMLYGLLILVVQIIIQLIYMTYCKKNFSEAKVRFSIDFKLWKGMLSFVGWIFVGNFAYVAYNQGVNVLLNMFFGPAVNAARAIAVQVQSAASRFIDSFQTALKPQIMLSYESQNQERLKSLISFGSRMSFALMYVLLLPFVFLVDDILQLWLGNVPSNASVFVVLLLTISTVRGISNPFMVAIQANGDIRSVQIMDGLVLIFVLPVSYMMLKLWGMPAWSVFLASLTFELIGFVCRTMIVFPKLKLKYSFFAKDVLFPIVTVMFVSAIIPCTLFLMNGECNLIQKILFSAISETLAFILVYFVGLKKGERNLVIQKIMGILRR